MFDYRDDTLSFDRYTVQPEEPSRMHNADDMPADDERGERGVWLFRFTANSEGLADMVYTTCKEAGLAVVRHDIDRVGFATCGVEESVLGQVLLKGFAALAFGKAEGCDTNGPGGWRRYDI